MLTIRRRDPTKRMAKFYRLALQGRLLLAPGIPNTHAVDLIREWGRLGSPGVVRVDPFENEAAALAAGLKLAARKQRKGYR